MAMFQFETITASQAMNLETDDVVTFASGPSTSASVVFGEMNGTSTVSITFAGHTVVFGPGVIVASTAQHLIFPDGSTLVMGGPRMEHFEGGQGADALFGGDGDDTLSGHDGANLLQGNQGDDSLVAGVGADTVYGGKGNDTIQTSPADVGHGEAGDIANGNLGDDTISSGNGDDTLLGGQGDDVIFGESGHDILDGNLGNDRISGDGAAQILGEAGNDTLTARGDGATLTGGAGSDLFVFVGGDAMVTHARATIADWAPEDSIQFSGVMANHAYMEITAPDFASALAQASQISAMSMDPMRGGGEIVVAQVGSDLYAFATFFNSMTPNAAILITGRTLADIGPQDFM